MAINSKKAVRQSGYTGYPDMDKQGAEVNKSEIAAILATALYRGSNKPVSGQQLAVIEILCNTPEFTDPEDIWLTAKEIHPVSRGTVYNIIRVFVDKGLIERERVRAKHLYRLSPGLR